MAGINKRQVEKPALCFLPQENILRQLNIELVIIVIPTLD
jgi:hypothetical protein